MDSKKQKLPKQQKKDAKSVNQLSKLMDKNQIIFHELKQLLIDQLNAYQSAFSRQNNKYIQGRDFDNFKQASQRFKRKGKSFIDRLSEIKNNCSTVIKNLPQQEKIVPCETNNCFDMFLEEQIQKTLQHKMKLIQYENVIQKPFQNQVDSFLE